jgi:hypothetical protein
MYCKLRTAKLAPHGVEGIGNPEATRETGQQGRQQQPEASKQVAGANTPRIRRKFRAISPGAKEGEGGYPAPCDGDPGGYRVVRASRGAIASRG